MTETIPSSRPYQTISTLLIPLLIIVFLAGSSFSSTSRLPSRSENAEMLQMREYITSYAQNFLGMRYRHGGVAPRTGFDCSGFTSYILKEFDVKVSSSSTTQATQGVKIPLDEVLPGDLVFFARKGRVRHVAMVVDRNEEGIFVVHSTCSRGIVVENISESSYWKPQILYARDVITQQVGH
jgi:cell wall-associated NlpC family hydrolase